MEFAMMESEGMFNESIDFEHWRCINANINDLTKLERSPSGGCWQNLNRVSIHNSEGYRQVENPIQSLLRINWQFYSNVVVLELKKNSCGRGSLNLEGLNCLRNLFIFLVRGLRIEGLDGLRNLAFFKWLEGGSFKKYDHSSIVGQLPISLKVVDVRVRFREIPDMLVRCSNLAKLDLFNIQDVGLNLSSCSKLQSLRLEEVAKLISLWVPYNLSGACNLKSLEVDSCFDLVNIQGLNEYIGLERLKLGWCPKYKLPDLRNLTKLQVLKLAGKEEVVGCYIPRHLRELYYECSQSNEVPSLRGCKQLEILHLHLGGGTDEETNLKDPEDLPALRQLRLANCRISSGWPDLSKSRKLEVIRLGYVAKMELQEDDIRMFVSLPLLQPLYIDEFRNVWYRTITLDLHRRKVLQLNFHTGCWEERDLDTSPIKLKNNSRYGRISK